MAETPQDRDRDHQNSHPELSKSPEAGTGSLQLDLVPRLFAEFLGTCLLLVAIVGSGTMATRLTDDVGVQLLAISIAVGLALVALILMFGDASGAHFNPVVTLLDRAEGTMNTRESWLYIAAQLFGGILGTVIANLMFGAPAIALSTRERGSAGLWLAEFVATLGLLLVIQGCVRTGRSNVVAFAVGAWIAAAHWFTSSTSFANPVVSISRMFTESDPGISPSSVPMFIVMQLLAIPAAYLIVAIIFRRDIRSHRSP